MKHKGWLIPILVFLVSILFLFSYQQRQDVLSFADTTALPPILWSENSLDIVRVVYKSAGKTIDTVRENENWIISASNKPKADALYIYKIITPFMEPLFKETIEETPADLGKYGIDDLSATLTFYDVEKNEYTLIKGKMASDTTTYVFVPLTKTIYTMEQASFEGISTSLNQWTSKELISFKTDDINKIDLVYKGHPATLLPTQTSEGISFNSSELEDRLVKEFITFLQTTKIQSFITEDANEHVLNVYGFNSPMLKCTLYFKDGSTHSLTIGTINEAENICYTQVSGKNAILGIPYFNLSQFNLLYSELQKADSIKLG